MTLLVRETREFLKHFPVLFLHFFPDEIFLTFDLGYWKSKVWLGDESETELSPVTSLGKFFLILISLNVTRLVSV